MDRAAGGYLFDQVLDPVHVFVAHALRGFVQQQQFGLQRQRGRAFQRLEFVDQVVQGPPRQYGADGDTQLHFPAGGDAFHAAGQIVQRLQHVAPVLQQGFARGRQPRPVS
ncbi:hypothetical protein G6F58_013464 [Rhizopus delemar]|nr:hypothetical protein G6F58_013464 [Rhizopus delemar]